MWRGCTVPTKEIVLDEYITPASVIPQQRWKNIKIELRRYTTYRYYLDSIDTYITITKPYFVRRLSWDNTWITDDDIENWYGILYWNANAHGKVLIGGLGLGMIQNRLKNNNRVTSITTVEINPEIIQFLRQYYEIGEVIQGDFYEYLKNTNVVYDTIIGSIWTISRNRPIKDIQKFEDIADEKFPYSTILHW
jgi:hypothetical protein